ncbi:uncharacterized protein EI97DRAFT_439415 [Westerdykella ornata]|uniref:2EXR domain-containing protein n=1 Tax=Westerdykella ornata TaxID=318751 RepID=A0A6A6JUU1_WESOR|nr:uncharacterized protein EI97DRAFT_439415 [Westerdykella ornata]KAF2280390.1 hypothetical protein EI97DRAFT_439415 [Westerdykella ornata]
MAVRRISHLALIYILSLQIIFLTTTFCSQPNPVLQSLILLAIRTWCTAAIMGQLRDPRSFVHVPEHHAAEQHNLYEQSLGMGKGRFGNPSAAASSSPPAEPQNYESCRAHDWVTNGYHLNTAASPFSRFPAPGPPYQQQPPSRKPLNVATNGLKTTSYLPHQAQRPTLPVGDDIVSGPSFPLFSRLPRHIRTRIFTLACPPPRTRFIELYDYDSDTNTTKVRYYPRLPGLFHACREARRVCLGVWGGEVVRFLPADGESDWEDWGYEMGMGDEPIEERANGEVAEEADEDTKRLVEQDEERYGEGGNSGREAEEKYEEAETRWYPGFYANLALDIIWLSSRFGPRLNHAYPLLIRPRPLRIAPSPSSSLSASSSNNRQNHAGITYPTPIPQTDHTYSPTSETHRLNTLNTLIPIHILGRITRLAVSVSALDTFRQHSTFAHGFRWLHACHTIYLLVLDDGFSNRAVRRALAAGKPPVGAVARRVSGLLRTQERFWREWEWKRDRELQAEVVEMGNEQWGQEWAEWVCEREERERVRRDRRVVEVGELRLDY